MNTKRALVVVAVERSEAGKEIYNLIWCFGIRVKVESKHPSKSTVQCLNCQDFGHTKAACRIKPACVRCTGSHPSYECPFKENKEVKAKCANCKEDHTSTFRGCKYFILKNEAFQNKKSFAAVAAGTQREPPTHETSQATSPENPDTSPQHEEKDLTQTNESRLSLALHNHPKKKSNSPSLKTKASIPPKKKSKKKATTPQSKPNSSIQLDDLQTMMHTFCQTMMNSFATIMQQTMANLIRTK